jgi:hypothetical protein
MEGLSLLLTKSFTEHKITGIKVSKFIKLFHLMFVDDVLLMTIADPAEWTVIQDVLSLFCTASGLAINHSKSTVHYWGLTESELICLKNSIPFSFIDLSAGFKYLGYRLKLRASSPDEWQWLVRLFERKIGGWCNIWLSLGGRLTLIKAVLEGLAVYWMTLERIPKKVINSIRRLSSNFLWNGTGRKHSFHLCGWDVLTRPKKTGGWGLKNLVYFNTALLASSFWRAANINSIWHRIVADKYFGSLHFCEWLRKPSLIPKRASTFWKGLVAASPVILHWLRWLPGSGSEIFVGRDKIIGVEDCSILSSSLISKLVSTNRSNLAQVGRPSDSHYLPDSWLGALIGTKWPRGSGMGPFHFSIKDYRHFPQ